jgi:hypothetical protein
MAMMCPRPAQAVALAALLAAASSGLAGMKRHRGGRFTAKAMILCFDLSSWFVIVNARAAAS